MTWTIRERPRVGGTVVHEYRCPVHGVFDAEVPRDAVPDVVTCPFDSWCVAGGDKEYASREEAEDAALQAGILPEQAHYETQRCADDAPWAGSSISCRVRLASFNRGKAEAPPTKHALTTRDLAEGMPVNEWKAKRQALATERRRAKIKAMR